MSYRFGDDGQGNYKFPTITICLDSFKWVGRSPNGLNCSFKGPQGFIHHLIYCTYNKKVLVYPFEKIEDVIEASKILEITDILDSFRVGYPLQWILEANNKEQNFKSFWKPILDPLKGFCYSFESRKFEVMHLEGGGNGELLRMDLFFDVS